MPSWGQEGAEQRSDFNPAKSVFRQSCSQEYEFQKVAFENATRKLKLLFTNILSFKNKADVAAWQCTPSITSPYCASMGFVLILCPLINHLSPQFTVTSMASQWRTSAAPGWLWSVQRSQNRLDREQSKGTFQQFSQRKKSTRHKLGSSQTAALSSCFHLYFSNISPSSHTNPDLFITSASCCCKTRFLCMQNALHFRQLCSQCMCDHLNTERSLEINCICLLIL